MSVVVAALGVVGLVALWLGLRYRRYQRSRDQFRRDNVSPDWLNENVYKNGRSGDSS